MKARCLTKTNKKYPDYGGRGIVVCQDWVDSFEVFYKDMGPKPQDGQYYTLGRKENNKGYYPENCRWETAKQQANNTRRSHFIEFNGLRLTISQWASALKINTATIHSHNRKRTPSETIALLYQKCVSRLPKYTGLINHTFGHVG